MNSIAVRFLQLVGLMKQASLFPSMLLIAAALLACKGGGNDVDVNVSCTGTNTTIDCDVKHKSGSVGANVCWGLKFTCQNGAVVTGDDFCQPVQPGATSQKRIPISELKGFDKCDKAVSTEVVNMKMSRL
jgi:hypothetical protein